MIDNTNGLSAADIAAVTGNNGFGGFGGEGGLFWLLVLFLFGFGNGGFGGGFGNGGYVDNSVQRGFDQAAIMGGIQGVQGAVTTGFGDTALGLANLSQAIMNQGYQGQIATLQGFNGMQNQFSQCLKKKSKTTKDFFGFINFETVGTLVA